ncbi:alkaline phosphatase PafA [Reichenbachiella ulvae]|uniref:Alkaline phosphatase family protein n=1 Tax=Reichenbachiella ulvae TaxID=2980104 RepID=A0ABT3CP51_9BACT|nr:alkaline phosphatase PafA [Reichenbachiella ulvae]MCV9385409.1 alkaline phosphatase family protein [Reichenbachiella ulvae]
MIKSRLILFLSLLCSTTAFSQKNQIEKPKLMVGIIVDQMRAEYLYRFYDYYGEGGFKRLMNQGYEFKNAHFNYVPTKTGPGHASVYTGTTPRVHGIIANDWYNKKSKEFLYCVEDQSANSIGGSAENGKISPVNLLSTTITDELTLFYQDRSKIIGMSIKDRGAVLPAGHHPDAAYWYDDETGEFMTSDYYKEDLPKWVKQFNKQKLVEKYMSGKWETLYPIEEYVESAEDDREMERDLIKGQPSVFPYDLTSSDKPYDLIKTTPWGNTILADFAKASIDGENLGQDEITDFLAVSFSSTDYAGHDFGPYSKEVQDMYVRLDRELESFFNTLDEKVGKGQWSVFLSADHAVAAIPVWMKQQDMPADYWNKKKLEMHLNETLKTKWKVEGLVESVSNDQIFLNHDLIKERGLVLKEIKADVMPILKQTPGIKAVYDADEIGNYWGGDYDLAMLSAGFNQLRSGDILFTIQSGWLSTYGKENKGTTHGTHYTYDTHVPMLFYGWGIKPGKSYRYHSITDIAPTISMLLNIGIPSGATGQPLYEIFE